MTRLRSGAVPSIQVGREKDGHPAPDPYEAGDRARANAAAYEAWVSAGKTREMLEAEQRQRHQRRAEARRSNDGNA